ncbi:hypothetical protein [Thermococcus henrietii]|uniref:hypothetical protein n=1 Tax=Thermococcus henrietii TaxID=2016361 RepID=UPI000C075FAD|nr:hypothetical protein [Thermococcus henrietii]
MKKIVKWIVILWMLGEITYSYQLVGFYYLLRIFNAPLSRLWLPLLINGLRFTLQSLILLGVLNLVLKKVPSIKLYALCSTPLAIAGLSSAVLRLSLPSEIGLRTLLEQLLLLVGFILLVIGLLRYYSKNLKAKKRKLIAYITAPTLAIVTFWTIIPIPL